MNLSIDQQIDAAHSEAERIEQEARQIEARILKAGGVPPRRPYGRPVSGEAVAQNLTLRSLLQRRDPALAAFLGCGSDLQRREAEERAARELQAQALQMQTDRVAGERCISALPRADEPARYQSQYWEALVMLSRPHPRHGWLHLQPGDWRATLDRQVEERDRLDDINHSGPAPAFVQWCDEQQMPKLAQHPHYHQQFQARITELQLKLSNLERDIAGGRLDLEPAAGIVRKELGWIEGLLS